MKYRFGLAAGMGALVLTAASALLAQQDKASEIRIYNGEPAMQSGVKLGGWGSGSALESEDHVAIGAKSVKITTHGRYQGGRLDFQAPINFKSVMEDPSAYLLLTVMLPSKDSSGFGLGAGDYSSLMSQGRRGGPTAGGGGNSGEFAGVGGGDSSNRMIKPKPLSELRLVMVTTDGKRTENTVETNTASVNQQGWSIIGIPVVALKGLKGSSGEVKELQLFGNSPGIIYLGEARVTHDDTPIRVDDLPEMTVALGDTVTFTGSADAGATALKYEWDFDDRDGVNVDAEGRVVKHRFRKSRRDPAGNSVPYNVTLRVSDVYGLKKAVTTTTKVTVTL